MPALQSLNWEIKHIQSGPPLPNLRQIEELSFTRDDDDDVHDILMTRVPNLEALRVRWPAEVFCYWLSLHPLIQCLHPPPGGGMAYLVVNTDRLSTTTVLDVISDLYPHEPELHKTNYAIGVCYQTNKWAPELASIDEEFEGKSHWQKAFHNMCIRVVDGANRGFELVYDGSGRRIVSRRLTDADAEVRKNGHVITLARMKELFPAPL